MPGGVRTLLIKWLSDSSDVEKGSKKATGALGKIGTVAAGVFTADAAMAAGKAALDFGKDAVKAAMDDQKSQSILANTLRNTTRARAPEIASVEKYIGRLADSTGVMDDELRPAFATLVRSTHDVGRAEGLMNTAMDVSAGTGRDLGSVTLALAKANNGQVGALGRLGIKVKGLVPDTAALSRAQEAQRKALVGVSDAIRKHGANSEEAKKAQEKYAEASKKVEAAQSKTKSSTMNINQVLKSLNQTYGGDAAKAADTSEGKMKRLNERWAEMKESIGYKLLPVLTTLMDWLLNKLPQAISFLVDWIGTNWPKIYSYISPFVTFLIGYYNATKQFVKGVIQVFQGLIQFVKAVFTGQWGQAWQGILKMFQGIWNMIMGVVRNAWNYIMLFIRVAIMRLGPIAWAGLMALLGVIGRGIAAILSYWALLPVRLVQGLYSAFGQLVSLAASLGRAIGSALWNAIYAAISGIGHMLAGVFRGAVNAVIDAWNSIDIGLHIKSYGIGPLRTPGIDINDIIPDIPRLAQGGITRGSGLAFLHPLEAVTPLKGGGLGNSYYITVNVPPMANPAAVGQATVTAIKAYERRNGASWRAG